MHRKFYYYLVFISNNANNKFSFRNFLLFVIFSIKCVQVELLRKTLSFMDSPIQYYYGTEAAASAAPLQHQNYVHVSASCRQLLFFVKMHGLNIQMCNVQLHSHFFMHWHFQISLCPATFLFNKLYGAFVSHAFHQTTLQIFLV